MPRPSGEPSPSSYLPGPPLMASSYGTRTVVPFGMTRPVSYNPRTPYGFGSKTSSFVNLSDVSAYASMALATVFGVLPASE